MSSFPQNSSADSAYVEAHDRRILIVDDEEPVRRLFAQSLGQFNCETAANAQEALEILAQKPFALVITDVHMPGLGGIELMRKIIELYPETAVIIVSGVDRTQRVIDAVRVGAFDYLIKPCDLGVLTLCVERALERRELLRNACRYKQDLEVRNGELSRQKSELQRLQAQIAHTEKMASLGQLVAGIAHELNNPAGFIYSNLAILKEHLLRLERYRIAYDEIILPPAITEKITALKTETKYLLIVSDLVPLVDDCYSGAERIRDVVQNLRLFSRLDEAEFKKVDLHEGIESTVRLLSRYYTTGHINLKRDYGQLPQIECYAAQMNQVWMNLLVNAAQAIGSVDGEVLIKTRCDERNVVASISDTGSGIYPKDLKKVFDPFFTTKPVGEGTGLGLSISHSIIERHGGKLVVGSVPGQGTTFTISIPIKANGTSRSA